VLKSCSSVDGGDKTRNLAIVNRSRVSSAHTVTTVGPKCSGRGIFHGEKVYETPVVAAATVSINLSMG